MICDFKAPQATSRSAGASLVEVLVATTIIIGAASTAAYQVAVSQKFRKSIFDRAAIVGLADSSALQTLLGLRANIEDAMVTNPGNVKGQILLNLFKAILTLPPGPAGAEPLTNKTAIPALPSGTTNAASYQKTIRRCLGKVSSRPKSPALTDSGLYFCLSMRETSGSRSGIWRGVNLHYPVLMEILAQPIETSTGQVLRFGDLKVDGPSAMVRIVYSIVWVSEKTKGANAVYWLGKEQYAPIL